MKNLNIEQIKYISNIETAIQDYKAGLIKEKDLKKVINIVSNHLSMEDMAEEMEAKGLIHAEQTEEDDADRRYQEFKDEEVVKEYERESLGAIMTSLK